MGFMACRPSPKGSCGSMTTPEAISVIINGQPQTISYEMAMRRLLNRAIDLTYTQQHRIDIAIVRTALVEVEKLLQDHYQEARRKEIRQTTHGGAQRRALQDFAVSSKRFLPPLWLRAFERVRNAVIMQFLDHQLEATVIDYQEGDLDSWWRTVVVSEIVKIGNHENITGLDDPNHPDFIKAEELFHTRAVPQLGTVVFATRPRRSVQHPENTIEFRLSDPRSCFTVNFVDGTIHWHADADWTQAVWDLWVSNLEPSVEFT